MYCNCNDNMTSNVIQWYDKSLRRPTKTEECTILNIDPAFLISLKLFLPS